MSCLVNVSCVGTGFVIISWLFWGLVFWLLWLLLFICLSFPVVCVALRHRFCGFSTSFVSRNRFSRNRFLIRHKYTPLNQKRNNCKNSSCNIKTNANQKNNHWSFNQASSFIVVFSLACPSHIQWLNKTFVTLLLSFKKVSIIHDVFKHFKRSRQWLIFKSPLC